MSKWKTLTINHAYHDATLSELIGNPIVAKGCDIRIQLKTNSEGLTINSGDYIDSREFTREECERFCELAVECGFNDKEGMGFYHNRSLSALGVASGGAGFALSKGDCGWGTTRSSEYGFTNNITTQFREFLDKEKGMKQFTKDDLKDGMLVEYRDGNVRYVIQSVLACLTGNHVSQGTILSGFNNDLTSESHKDLDIMKVTDRDGTILFEREPELKEVTLKLTQEQIDSLKKQGIG